MSMEWDEKALPRYLFFTWIMASTEISHLDVPAPSVSQAWGKQASNNQQGRENKSPDRVWLAASGDRVHLHHPFVVTIVFFQPQIASRAAHLWHIHDPSLLLIEYQFLILVLTSSEMQARRVQCTKLIRRLNPRFSIFSLEFAHFVPSNCGTLGD